MGRLGVRLVFVYWPFEDQGSGLVIQGYTRAARAMGHEVQVYGIPYSRIPLDYTIDAASADAVVFIFEWTTGLYYGDRLDLLRLVSALPRARRVVVDGDGNYNDRIAIAGDENHLDAAAASRWIDVCDSLTDKVCQPTLHPLRPHVRPFLFYAYDPAWERPVDRAAREFDLLYVGHSKFRWGPMRSVLAALKPVRQKLGRIGIVGHGWATPPAWAKELGVEDQYFSDPAELEALGVEILPAVPFTEVLGWMGRATMNPVLSRPTFRHLQLVTPRVFETPAAGTIPLLGLDEGHTKEVYGEAVLELVLPVEAPHEKILDIVNRPDHYTGVLGAVREHLRTHHSYESRLAELVEIVEG
jgi:hypothetical protein